MATGGRGDGEVSASEGLLRRAPRDENPYLSVVVTARNDNHGGDLLFRMQVFVNALFEQCNRFGVTAELVVVEWNPPSERPRLAEALAWPEDGGCVSVRIIEVGEELHRRFRYSDRLPLFQMIAKNVGIRRARGRFVLATNIDIVLSDALMRFLAERKLRAGRFYRVDRYDVSGVRDVDAPIDEQLRLCEQSLIRICGRYGTLDLRTGEFYRVWLKYATLPWYLAIALQMLDSFRRTVGARLSAVAARCAVPVRATRLAWFRATQRRAQRPGAARTLPMLALRALVRPWKWPRAAWIVGRYVFDAVRRPRAATSFAGRLLAQRFELARARLARAFRRVRRGAVHLRRMLVAAARSLGRLSGAPSEVAYRVTETRRRWRRRWRTLRDAAVWARALPALHTNACGDFTLMSREDWSELEAYPELHAFSMFIDSIFVYQAYWHGFREEFLPHPIYHLEHGAGFKPDTEGLNDLNDRLEKAGIPQIDNEQFRAYAIEMYRARAPLSFNDEDWGLADVELPETVISDRQGLVPSGVVG